MDLWFYHSILDKPDVRRTIIHMIDACIRWSANTVLKNKDEMSLCNAISTMWISLWGPMQVMVQDGETGMRGRAVADFADANHFQLKFKPPGSKAWIAESHQSILRKTAHTTELQLQKEGIFATIEQVIAIITFLHNALISQDGVTAYNALLGRTPTMLPSTTGGTLGEIDDTLVRGESGSRHHNRIREIATTKIVEVTAKDRINRASRHQTRLAMELSSIKPGMKVDIWFDPTNKDVKGWRGPAEGATIQHTENVVTV